MSGHVKITVFLLALLTFVAAPMAGGARAAGCDGPTTGWIDTHVHPAGGRGQWTDFPAAVRAAADVIHRTPVSMMVLMPQPQIHNEQTPFAMEYFLDHLKDYPGCFVYLGGGGTLNSMIHQDAKDGTASEELRTKFTERAEAIIKAGARGFGEIAVMHLSLLPDHAFENVPADHPLLLLLADIAAKHGAVIDIHFDVVTSDMKAPEWLDQRRNPSEFKENLTAFERLIAHNRNARIVWAHVGSDMLGHWTVELSRRMLKTHPNLYMSFRSGTGQARQNHPLKKGGFKPGWMDLFRDFPDRFVIGGDQFFASSEATGPVEVFAERAQIIRKRTNIFLKRLPDELKSKFAYENAMRIYKIGPGP